MKLKKLLKEAIDKNTVISYLKATMDPIVFNNYDNNTMAVSVQLSNGKKFDIMMQNPLTQNQLKLLKKDPKSFFHDLGIFEVHSVVNKSFN